MVLFALFLGLLPPVLAAEEDQAGAAAPSDPGATDDSGPAGAEEPTDAPAAQSSSGEPAPDEDGGEAKPLTSETAGAGAAPAPPGEAAPPAQPTPPPAAATAEETDPVLLSAPLGEALDPFGAGAGAGTQTLFSTPGTAAGRPVSLGAFADVGLMVQEPLESTVFTVGQVVLHSRALLGNGFSVFGELSLNSVPTFQARVERLLFDWEASDHLKVSAGRMHSPVTWWNSTFHHGLWLQTTASRPRMVGFADAFVPNHHRGIRLSGLAPFLEKAGLRYQVGVSNSSDDDAPGDGLTVPHSASVFSVLAVEPQAAPFLRIGVSGNQDFEQALAGQTKGARRLQAGAHVAYTRERPEIIGEVVVVRHTNPTGGGAGSGSVSPAAKHESAAAPPATTDDAHAGHAGHEANRGALHTSGSAYLQVAWRLRAVQERFKPYLRYEQVRLHENDLSLLDKDSQEILLGGVRVDLTPQVALKGEGTWDLLQNEAWSAQLQLSAAW